MLVMVLYWTYYIRCVRREPGSEDRYDESAWDGAVSDGVLFIYPYCSLNMSVAGAAGLVASANPPEFVYMALKVELTIALAIGGIGFTGVVGVPLSWPVVSHRVVDIRKAKRARRRERRKAREREAEEYAWQLYLRPKCVEISAFEL